MYGVRECSNFVLLHVAVQFSQHHLLKRLSFPCCLFLSPVLCLGAQSAPLSMGILQARILEGVAMPSSRGSSQPRNQTQVSHIAGRFFTIWVTSREAQEYWSGVAYPVSRGPSQPRNQTRVFCFAGGFFTIRQFIYIIILNNSEVILLILISHLYSIVVGICTK